MKKEDMRRILEKAESLSALLRKALSEQRYDDALLIAAERRSLLGISGGQEAEELAVSPELLLRLLRGGTEPCSTLPGGRKSASPHARAQVSCRSLCRSDAVRKKKCFHSGFLDLKCTESRPVL